MVKNKLATIMSLLILATLGCKQESFLKEQRPGSGPTGKELSGSYSPYVFSPLIEYGFFFPSSFNAEIEGEGPVFNYVNFPMPSYSFAAGIHPDNISYVINQGNKANKNNVNVEFIFHPQAVDGVEDLPTNFKKPSYVDLIENPESFRTPLLSDFCSETDDSTLYIAHKYQAEALQGSLYAFSVIGSCDGEQTRCALVYYSPDEVDPEVLFPPAEPGDIFDNQYSIAQLMGIDGTHANCTHMDAAAFPRPGCMDPGANNTNPFANISEPSECTYSVLGCTDPMAFNYSPLATQDDSSCIPVIFGCMDPGGINYDPLANTDSGCVYPPPTPIFGCTDPGALNYNPQATVNVGCMYPQQQPIMGCMDPGADNYDPSANTPSACTYSGCMHPTALNYNPQATIDDGSCQYNEGCTDPMASNYDPQAMVDDGSCNYDIP